MKEFRFVLTCRTQSPLSLRGNGSEFTDADFRRDGHGRLTIPGTSLAGVLRTIVERVAPDGDACWLWTGAAGAEVEACGCAVCRLFGNVRPGAPEAAASRVRVFDAPLRSAQTRIVDGVALDRERRAASQAKKFDYAEVGRQAEFDLELIVAANDEDEESSVALVREALAWFAAGYAPIGARGSSGLGVVEAVGSVRELVRDWDDTDDLVNALAGAGDEAWRPVTSPATSSGSLRQSPLRLTFDLKLRDDSTFLIADPEQAARTGFDRAPRGGVRAAELPGTSLRGVLRSQAERILRTLQPDRLVACDVTKGGCKRPRSPESDATWCCRACRMFGNEGWGSRVALRVQPSTSPGTEVPFDHVALDRFTGGARDKLKFNALAVRGVCYPVIVTIDEADAGERDWMLGLLVLALGDLHAGRCTVGHGGSKGHGYFEVRNMRLEGATADEQADRLQRAIEALGRAVS